MIRTLFSLAVAAVAGYVVLQLVFGVATGILGLLLGLAWLLLRVLLVVGLCYWLLTVFAPETARRARSTFGGIGTP